MEAKRIQGFSGEIPKLDRALIPDNAAYEAANVFLTSGRLDPMNNLKAVQSLSLAGQKTIYRMFSNGQSYWLSWKEQVDVAESPVFVENNFRIAFTSPDFEPRQTDLSLASNTVDPTAYPAQWYVLGVTPPITAPTVSSVTGGSGTNESRTYVYTFANQWGEESAPSPASTVFSGFPTGAWNLSVPDIAPSNSYTISNAVWASGQLKLTLTSVFGLRTKEKITLAGLLTAINISWRIDSIDVTNKFVYITMTNPGTLTSTAGTATRDAPHNTTGMTKRVYRSVTNADGTNFYLVGSDILAATTTFVDNFTIIGEVLPTLEWDMPPADLEGIVVHSSGCTVGFRGNEVYLSEPYAPYAYKLSNVQVLDFQVVGMGVFGQSVVIGTKGKPYVLSFVAPETATPQKVDQNWPCLCKQGITSFNGGVYYPTTVGLALVGTSGAVLATKQYFAQRDWQAVSPDTFISGYYDDRYYAIYTVGGVSNIIVISDQDGISTINSSATAMFTDRETGEVYICYGNTIYQLNGDVARPVEYSWTSKEFIVPNPINLGAARVDFSNKLTGSTLDQIIAANIAISASNVSNFLTRVGLPGFTEVNALEVNNSGLKDLLSTLNAQYVTFTLIVNGTAFYQKLVSSSDIFRLPAGAKYDRYSVRISGTAPVSSVVIAETPMGLKAV